MHNQITSSQTEISVKKQVIEILDKIDYYYDLKGDADWLMNEIRSRLENVKEQTEISDSTITDQIDGIIFQLPFDDKIKLWKLIEKLVEENRTEISDEEIENCVGDGMHDFYKGGFIEGAKKQL